MEASARLVAGSHNHNELVVIHGHEEPKALKDLNGQDFYSKHNNSVKRNPKSSRCGTGVLQTPPLKLLKSSSVPNRQPIGPRLYLYSHCGIILAGFVSPPPDILPL
ncbi:hypothetical protein AgCh_018689 [Apium graveolens]